MAFCLVVLGACMCGISFLAGRVYQMRRGGPIG